MNTMRKPSRSVVVLTACGILLLAIGFNTWRLTDVPPGLDRDAAANGLMALKWLREGIFPFWMSHASAPEPIIVWMQTLSTALFGPSVFALRIISALAMSLTALVVYILGLEVGRGLPDGVGYWAALFAGLTAAVNPVINELGRTGLRATTLPLLSALFFLTLLTALRKEHWILYGVTGLLLGLCAYTYLAARLLVVVVAIYLMLYCITSGCDKRKAFGISGMLLVACVTVTPQLLFFAKYPSAFIERAQAVSLAHNPLLEESGWLSVFGRKLAGIVTMFGIRWSGQYNQSARPLLCPLSFIGLLLALPVVVRRRRSPGLLLMSVALPVMLLPDLIAGDRLMPHELRAIGSYVPVFVLSGVGLACAVNWFGRKLEWPVLKWLAPVLALLLIVLPALDWQSNIAPRLAASEYEWYSHQEVQSAAIINASESPMLVPLAEYSRPVVAYLGADRVQQMNSWLDGDSSRRMSDIDKVVYYRPADPDRPRIESVSYTYDPRTLVLVDGEQAYLMPPAARNMEQLLQNCRSVDPESGDQTSEGEFCTLYIVDAFPVLDEGATKWSVNQSFGGQYLLDDVSANEWIIEPGMDLGVTSYWRVDQPGKRSLRYFVHVLDDQQRLVAGEDLVPGYGIYGTDVWKTGETIPVHQNVRLPDDLPTGRYWLELGLYDRLSGERMDVHGADGTVSDRVLVGPLKVKLGGDATLDEGVPLIAEFGNILALESYALTPGENNLDVRMLMTALEPPGLDYTFFVHVTDEFGKILAQADVQPLNGAYPTSIWEPGESVIVDARVPLPDQEVDGDTSVWIGVYDAQSSARLHPQSQDAIVDENRLLLDRISLP